VSDPPTYFKTDRHSDTISFTQLSSIEASVIPPLRALPLKHFFHAKVAEPVSLDPLALLFHLKPGMPRWRKR
jgi:hypothetical protein